MAASGDAIADCVLDAFRLLPARAKPRIYPSGTQEWVPLSGIVVSDHDGHLKCCSLGTGMRCLPATKVPLARGWCLHDWHAEVVAIRAFNHFLLQECADLATSRVATSNIIRRRAEEEMSNSGFQPYAVKEGIRIHMYSSEAPCGDASMELIMNSQEDATPWTKPNAGGESCAMLKGRGYFSELGIVRRKPSRGDAAETLSKSCSDKLSMKQCTSLLSALLSLLIHPSNAYLQNLVLPECQRDYKSTSRAFGADGRMAPFLGSSWQGGYAFRPFEVGSTSREFSFSRRTGTSTTKSVGSNITAIWTPRQQEVLIGGTIQGSKQFLPKGGSSICKANMWRLALAVSYALALPMLCNALEQAHYKSVKASALLATRRNVKREVRDKALNHWVCNDGGDDFALVGLKTLEQQI